MSSPWAGTVIGEHTPANQRRALPRLSVQQFISGGGADTIIFANHVTMVFSPAALQFTALQPVAHGTQFYMATGFVDVAPCQFFALTLLRSIPLGDLSASRNLYPLVQFRQTPGDVPPIPSFPSFTGTQLFETSAIQFPAEAGPAIQRYTLLWTPFSRTGSTANNTTLAIGPYVQIAYWAAAAPPAGDNSTYSLGIVAST